METELPILGKVFLLEFWYRWDETSLAGAKEKFPRYYEAYYELVVGTVFLVMYIDFLAFSMIL